MGIKPPKQFIFDVIRRVYGYRVKIGLPEGYCTLAHGDRIKKTIYLDPRANKEHQIISAVVIAGEYNFWYPESVKSKCSFWARRFDEMTELHARGINEFLKIVACAWAATKKKGV